MIAPSARRDWFFPLEEAPVHALITRNGVERSVRLPKRKALVATDTGEVVGVVGEAYRIFTNQQALDLCKQFCLQAFKDTRPGEWDFKQGHGPSTRSWVAMDLHHQAHTMNLWGNGAPSEVFTPFVRITNSYNGSRALRVDIGFMRMHCSNGVIFEQEAATLTVPHTRQGIRSLKAARPFAGMAALCEDFRDTLSTVRRVELSPAQALDLVRHVTGWPTLPENPKPWETADQSALDDDLCARLDAYFHELGGNAYAAFNTMTDLAARPPQSPRFRRDRPTLERRAGAWLRDLSAAATRPRFSISAHLAELADRK